MATEKRLIDANALKTVIQGTVSKVALDAPYDPEWFTRLAARQFEILKIIADAPTVEAVEVVHGRWMKTCLPDIYHCTNCKRATKMDELCDSEILRAYCPNCGADMRGDGNDAGC